jgi:hypothetical protein
MGLLRLLRLTLIGLIAVLVARPAHATEKRKLPDYDRRGPEPTTPGDVALWVPRIVLFPVYLVSEYVVRKPLGWAISGAERAGVPAALYDFFAFGPNHQAGFFPTAYVDFGFRASVGLYVFWNNAFVPGHDLVVRGSYGGKDWLTATVMERFRFGPQRRSSLTLEAQGLSRPDLTYFGLGPDTRQSARTRFGADRLQFRSYIDQRPTLATLMRTELLLRTVEFRQGGFGDDPTLNDAIAAGALPPPPGYPEGYTLAKSELTLSYDQRRLPKHHAGIFGGARGALNSELRTRGTFVTYGAKAGAFVDLNHHSRVLSLAASARFADPLAGSVIPFPELVTLGGTEPMRAYVVGRLVDRSAAVGELTYRWPVWIWLNGTLRGEIGNVFGEHLAGFSAGKLRWSGTIGIETTNPAETGFEMLLGVGSETFESGGKVDAVRFVIGTTNGI